MPGNLEPTDEMLHAKSIIQTGVKTGLETIGKGAAIATLYHIQTKFGLGLADIPDRPDDLCRAMRGIFGVGSTILVRSILDKLRMMPVATDEERKYVMAFTTLLEECIKLQSANVYA